MLIQNHSLNGMRNPCLLSTGMWLLHLVNVLLWIYNSLLQCFSYLQQAINHNEMRSKSCLTRHQHAEFGLVLPEHSKGYLPHFDELHQGPSLVQNFLYPWSLCPILQQQIHGMCGTSLDIYVRVFLGDYLGGIEHLRCIISAYLNNVLESNLLNEAVHDRCHILGGLLVTRSIYRL